MMNNPGLLVGGSPDEITELTHAFGDWSVDLMHTATLAQALALAKQRPMRVIVAELELPDFRGVGAVSMLVAQGAPVIALVRPGEEALGQECVQAGARAFVVRHPFWTHDLTPLREAVSGALVAPLPIARKPLRRAPARMTAFLGAKGGVGTSTVAMSAALLAAQAGTDTVLVELRATRGSLAPWLRAEPRANLSALARMRAEEIGPRDVERCLVRMGPNFRVMFAPQQVAEYGELRADQTHAILQALAQLAEAIVLDVPCGGGPANQVAVHECEAVNLVMDSDPTSLLPAEAALARLARWRLPAGRVGLVLTSRQGLPAPLMPSQVTDRLELEVRAWVPQLSRGQLEQIEREGPQPGLVNAFAAALRPGVVERLCRGDAEARYRFVLGRAAVA